MIVQLRCFAAAREAAGRGADDFSVGDDATVADLLSAAATRYGDGFAAVVRASRIWVNGDEPAAGPDTRLAPDDEVAVLPPVSGGDR
ncbi:MAG: MoaD/ThiS family protein [Actinomycetota bacterium]